jgi:molybdate/tungstate transport system substrate-binding protein
VLTIVCAGLVAAGCSSSSSGSSGSSPAPSASPKGTASVAYASSLPFLNEKVAAPAFTTATGYKYTGRGDSSGALEADIAGGEISPNVFEAVGGDNIVPLEPKFTKWLDTTLQSGQLDASSAFITQAVELHLPYIKLPA